ncbi:gamma-glutamyltransferase [Oscillatoria sp. CS-180]|uniref:gamma-glutamyltransferase n=1 Tax=Oscillatoria sp. CS-180 TaxID=3021720 RepID=UPI00232B51EA|nr:gamma-glutamyltransferase [Oscillatoria sp. CS-180]MDB9529540.1 gamma-glutamyltransferase [Oscillatoria sp. CS-180]
MADFSISGRGVVAAGHPLTAEAGAEILRRGGNAFDAAIAAVMTAWVTESVLTSAGGGGFLLAYTATGQSRLFDFFTQTPQQNRLNQTPDFYPINANFGDTLQEFHIGLGSMAVPGAIAGLLHVHQQLGRLPLADIVEPAIHHAKTGVVINPFLAYVFEVLKPILTASAAASDLYTSASELLVAGDTLKMPQLAETLTQIAEKGASVFYEGAIAQQIAEDCKVAGGYLTLHDLQNYQVIERDPLSLSYRDATFLTNPSPSSGGTLIGFSLKLLEQIDLSRFEQGSAEHLACLTKAMALTNEARRNGYDEKLYESDVDKQFLATDNVASYQNALQGVVNRLGSTTHISAVDAEGNAASVTTSNGEGSSYIIPGTAIMVNNMLGEEDLHPLGFHQWTPNQRISSMMAPSIIVRNSQPQIVLGSGGSNRIRTAILQVISNVLDFQMPLAEAIHAPRLHWEGGLLHLEPGWQPEAVHQAQLEETTNTVHWQQQNMFFGGVHAVAINQDKELQGAGDSRRGGETAIA